MSEEKMIKLYNLRILFLLSATAILIHTLISFCLLYTPLFSPKITVVGYWIILFFMFMFSFLSPRELIVNDDLIIIKYGLRREKLICNKMVEDILVSSECYFRQKSLFSLFRFYPLTEIDPKLFESIRTEKCYPEVRIKLINGTYVFVGYMKREELKKLYNYWKKSHNLLRAGPLREK